MSIPPSSTFRWHWHTWESKSIPARSYILCRVLRQEQTCLSHGRLSDCRRMASTANWLHTHLGKLTPDQLRQFALSFRGTSQLWLRVEIAGRDCELNLLFCGRLTGSSGCVFTQKETSLVGKLMTASEFNYITQLKKTILEAIKTLQKLEKWQQ